MPMVEILGTHQVTVSQYLRDNALDTQGFDIHTKFRVTNPTQLPMLLI